MKQQKNNKDKTNNANNSYNTNTDTYIAKVTVARKILHKTSFLSSSK